MRHLALLAAVLSLAACSGTTSARLRPVPTASPEALVELDLRVNAALDNVEPKPSELTAAKLTGGAALTAKANQLVDLCTSTKILDSLSEPPAHDARKLLAYATTYQSVLRVTDLRATVEDAQSPPDNRHKLTPSNEVGQAVTIEIAAMYAYEQRLLAGQKAVARKDLPARLLPAWLDRAWVRLVDDYTAADRSLATWSNQHCLR